MGENEEKVNVTANIDLTSVMALLIENNSYLKMLYEYKAEELSISNNIEFSNMYSQMEAQRETYVKITIENNTTK
jgi:hypothetical protein